MKKGGPSKQNEKRKNRLEPSRKHRHQLEHVPTIKATQNEDFRHYLLLALEVCMVCITIWKNWHNVKTVNVATRIFGRLVG